MKQSHHIYFDNAAAAPPDEHVLKFYFQTLANCFANQEARHGMADDLRRRLTEAGGTAVAALSLPEHRIFWGNSGSELFALCAGHPGFRGGNIVSTALEHPALLAALKRTGAELRMAPCPGGKVDPDKIRDLLDDNTTLVAMHHVHNETGYIQDILSVRQAMNELAPCALLLLDAIQSAGKIPLPREASKIDIVAVSACKIGVPGGAALLLRQRPQVDSLAAHLESCRNQLYLAGRVNPALAITLAEGIRYCVATMSEVAAKITCINQYLRKNLAALRLSNGKKIRFTVPPDKASPYILHFTVPGYQGAVLVRMLSARQIHAATGSACSAETSSPSKSLLAMGFDKDAAYAAMRLSFWRQNTLEDAKRFMDAFTEAIRRY